MKQLPHHDGQERTSRQGWPMALPKYPDVGWCLPFLLTMALLVAGLPHIAH